MAAALQSPAPGTDEVLVGPQRIWRARCATCLTSDFVLCSSVQQESPEWKSSAAALSRSLLVSKASPTWNKPPAPTSFVQESSSGTVNPLSALGPLQVPGQSQLVPMTSSAQPSAIQPKPMPWLSPPPLAPPLTAVPPASFNQGDTQLRPVSAVVDAKLLEGVVLDLTEPQNIHFSDP